MTRDSFLPFGSCQLCLLIARDPVACAIGGDIFCRECAVSNLIAQHKEIKRLEKESAHYAADAEMVAQIDETEARDRAVKEFETIQMGFNVTSRQIDSQGRPTDRNAGKSSNQSDTKTPSIYSQQKLEKKRKFEIDEDELSRIVKEDRSRAKAVLSQEKVFT